MNWGAMLAYLLMLYVTAAFAATVYFLAQVPWRPMILRPGQNEIEVGRRVVTSVLFALIAGACWFAWPALYVLGVVARRLAL